MPVDAQMNYGSSSVHLQWFSCWNIRADNHDIIRWHHEGLSCYSGRETIKGEHNQALGLLLLSSGCFDTSIWLFSKPQTLYFSCLGAPRVGSISRMHSVVCFSISMHPDLFGGLWVIVTLFIWWWPGRSLPSPLEPGIEQCTDHNLLVVNCEGGINR